MAPPYDGSGSSELTHRGSISFDEYNEIDFFDTNVEEQMRTIPDERESGSKSPYSLDSMTVESNTPTSHRGDYPYSELDQAKYFPLLLHAIVSDESSDSVVHWLGCGTIFVIANKEEFTQNILSTYFGKRGGGAMATKFTSFTRRLKRWNFQRIPSGRNMGSYHHKYFIRGKPELAKKIAYPLLKEPSSPSIRRKNVSPVIAAVKKARRRATTGSIAASEITTDDLVVLRATAASKDLKNIPTVSLQNLLSDGVDFDMWLNSADFTEEEFDSTSVSSPDNQFGQEPSISSNEPTPASSGTSNLESYLPKFSPPPMFSDVNSFLGRKNIGDPIDQALPMPKTKVLRRSTISLPSATKVIMMPETFPSLTKSGNNWLDGDDPSFGTNNPSAHNEALSSTSSNLPIPSSYEISSLGFHRPKFSPPPMFSDVFPSVDRKNIGDPIDQALPMRKTKVLRRSTISSPCRTKMTMMPEMFSSFNSSGNNWLDGNEPSFGTNNPYAYSTALISTSSNEPTEVFSDISSLGFHRLELPPPPMFSDVFPSVDRKNLGVCTDQALPMPKTKGLRRSTISSPCTTKVAMMPEFFSSTTNYGNNWLDGTNNLHAYNSEVSSVNYSSGTLDDVPWAGTNKKNPHGRESYQFPDHLNLADGTNNPYSPNTGVSIANFNGIASDDDMSTNQNSPQGEPHPSRDPLLEEDSCDAYFRESRLDLVCAIDPFT